MATPAIYCGRCGKALGQDERPCSRCRSDDRVYAVSQIDSLDLLERLGLEQRDATGFRKIVDTIRLKFAAFTGRLARESLRLTKTDPAVTRKRHLVEEQAPDGSWVVVHDERQEFPAKRRP